MKQGRCEMGFQDSFEKTRLGLSGPAGAADRRLDVVAITPPPITKREAAAQAAELAFKCAAVERLKRHDPDNAVMLLDGLERFFEGGEFWLRKNDGAAGNRCLVGGIEEARRAYQLSDSQPAHYYLSRAIDPHAGNVNLPEWNAKCGSFAKLAQADQQRLHEIEMTLPRPAPRRRWWRGKQPVTEGG